MSKSVCHRLKQEIRYHEETLPTHWLGRGFTSAVALPLEESRAPPIPWCREAMEAPDNLFPQERKLLRADSILEARKRREEQAGE